MSWIENSQEYVNDIELTADQQHYLVNQVSDQLDLFYKGSDPRKIVLNAFTGSGKTTVTIKSLIPEFIRRFHKQGKKVIAFTAPLAEVVAGAHRKAASALDNKIVHGKKVRVYDQSQLSRIEQDRAKGIDASLDGDVAVLFLTAQYLNFHFGFIQSMGGFDLLIPDEAHRMFGTIDAEDTKADKGQHIKDFRAITLEKINLMPQCAVLFLTATPTTSQQGNTNLGALNNIYLSPMPRSTLTTPFFDFIPYFSNKDALLMGLEFFKKQCDSIGKTMSQIDADTWHKSKKNFFPSYPALMARVGRRGAINGLDFDDYINRIRALCAMYDFRLFISRSDQKEFDGKNIRDLDEGVRLGSKTHDKPIVMVVIESGTAGVDFVKLNNVVIAREPSVPIHNNYSQTAGRAARMKFGFVSHEDAVKALSSYKIDQEQKRLLAEYYIQHATSTVHIPANSDVLTNDVREFVESGSFRESEGRKYILDMVFGEESHPTLSVDTSIVDDTYKRFKKDYCECCDTDTNGRSVCYNVAKKSLEKLIGKKLNFSEMDSIWPMCLHVHHQDGNHFNHDPNNLITICPTVHAAVTMINEDYNNRYPILRELLEKQK